MCKFDRIFAENCQHLNPVTVLLSHSLYSVLRCVTLCYVVLQRVTVCYGVLQRATACYGVLWCVMVFCCPGSRVSACPVHAEVPQRQSFL